MHVTGAWILLLFMIAAAGGLLFALHLTRAGIILHERIPDRPRRRLFLAAVSFVVTFVGARVVVLAIVYHVVPFSWVILGGLHIHHLVWGITLLLVSGYAMVAEWGTSATPLSLFTGRLLSILYGMGAALTLDEFTMWLNIRQVDWSLQSRASIDAVILFAVLLAAGAWGAPLWTKRPRKHHRPKKHVINEAD
jgi:hypothetical protein